jgi:hypothetical protein
MSIVSVYKHINSKQKLIHVFEVPLKKHGLRQNINNPHLLISTTNQGVKQSGKSTCSDSPGDMAFKHGSIHTLRLVRQQVDVTKLVNPRLPVLPGNKTYPKGFAACRRAPGEWVSADYSLLPEIYNGSNRSCSLDTECVLI